MKLPCIATAALLAAALSGFTADPAVEERRSMIVAIGAPGEEKYGTAFGEWGAAWEEAAKKAALPIEVIGRDEQTDHLSKLRDALAKEPREGAGELWVVLLGHGTWDRTSAKFNLRGDDLSAGALADLLRDFRRPVVVVAAFSSSGAFLQPLAGPRRILVTATRSGTEENFARFGLHLSAAIVHPGSDLDRDGQVSLLEAFISASNQVAEYYKTEGRLATEHALIDDNGDGLGTPADWFQGVRAVKKAKENAPVDGAFAHQIHLLRSGEEQSLSTELRLERDRLEGELTKLRDRKAETKEDDYYRELEKLLLQIARLYEARAD